MDVLHIPLHMIVGSNVKDMYLYSFPVPTLTSLSLQEFSSWIRSDFISDQRLRNMSQALLCNFSVACWMLIQVLQLFDDSNNMVREAAMLCLEVRHLFALVDTCIMDVMLEIVQ